MKRNKFIKPPPKSFLIVNKQLLQKYGPDVAVFICNLIDKNSYFKKRYPYNEGWFFLPYRDQTMQTSMKRRVLQKCKDFAERHEMIFTKQMGYPPQIHYKLNLDNSEINAAIPENNLVETPQTHINSPLIPKRDQQGSQKGINGEGLKHTVNQQDNTCLDGTRIPNKNTKVLLYMENNSEELFLQYLPKQWQKYPPIVLKVKEWIAFRKEMNYSIDPPLLKKLAEILISIASEKEEGASIIQTAIKRKWKGFSQKPIKKGTKSIKFLGETYFQQPSGKWRSKEINVTNGCYEWIDPKEGEELYKKQNQ